jgi:TolB-like protein/Tfp pilus assembly protein PilF
MSLFAELKRRNVFRVGVAYAIVAWLLVEVASVVLPTFGAPEWVMKVVTFLVILGLPLALVLAWAFELTPEGIKRETVVDPAESITSKTGRKFDFAIIGLLAVAVVYFAVDKFALDADPEPAESIAEVAPTEETKAREKTIAVLPFVNMSKDPDNEYFSDGLADTLLHKLAQISSLRVVARTSSFAFKGQNVDIRTIGEQLGVSTIVEGSVQKSGDRLRIIAQLIDVADGSHLWSKNFDRPEEDLFAIQDEIAKEIAAALEVTLLGEESARLSQRSVGNLESYDAYLKCLAALNRNMVADFKEAIRHCQRAIEIDPGNALAHVGLAAAHLLLFDWGMLSFEAAHRKAERELTTALALDPNSDGAFMVLGYLKQLTGDLQIAESAYEHVLVLNPNNARARWYFAELLLGAAARPHEALEQIEAAIKLDPLQPGSIGTRVLALAWLDREEEWKAQLAEGIEQHPDNSYVYWVPGWIARQDGQLDETVRWFRETAKRDPESPLWPAVVAIYLIQLGADREAEPWLDLADFLGPDSYQWLRARFRMDRFRQKPEAMRESALQLLGGAYRLTYQEYLEFYEWLRWLQLEEPDLALAYYERFYPQLLRQIPGVNAFNHAAAIGLAHLQLRRGARDEANRLLEAASAVVETMPWRSLSPDTRAMIYTLQGDPERALAELRSVIDRLVALGWRHLEWEPVYEPLRSHPEFREMINELKADKTLALQLERLREMEKNGELAVHPAAQLVHVREMERNGESEPIPDVSATTH